VIPPTCRSGDERSSPLVAEPVRLPQLALSQAAVEGSLGRVAQARRRQPRAGELGEFVEVDLGDLDLGHARHRRRRQSMFDDLARRQRRGRIDRQHTDAVEGHGPVQGPRRGQRQVAHAQVAVHEPENLGPSTPPRAGLHPVVVAAAERHPTRITQDSGMAVCVASLHAVVVSTRRK
jgi:hypothetical protein